MKREYIVLTIARISLILALVLITLQYIFSITRTAFQIEALFNEAIDLSQLQDYVKAELSQIKAMLPLVINIYLIASFLVWVGVILVLFFINKKGVGYYFSSFLAFLIILKIVYLIWITFCKKMLVTDLNEFAISHGWFVTLNENKFKQIFSFNFVDILSISCIIFLVIADSIYLSFFVIFKKNYSFAFFTPLKKSFNYLKINYYHIYLV